MYFDKSIALFHRHAKDQKTVFDLLSAEFLKDDLVTDEFRKKVEERELVFPTGLSIDGMGVAIPHTDSIYVKRSQIGFMSLTEAVNFKEMGSGENVEVQLVFMLALKEPHEQLEMLQKLVAMFQNPGVLDQLKRIKTQSELSEILLKNGLK